MKTFTEDLLENGLYYSMGESRLIRLNMRSKNLWARQQINDTFPHQLILPRHQCSGRKAELHRLYLANNNTGFTHRSAVVYTADKVLYCFKHREDAMRFRWHFGGRSLDRHEMHGQLWFDFG